jgi:hypothetical protein
LKNIVRAIDCSKGGCSRIALGICPLTAVDPVRISRRDSFSVSFYTEWLISEFLYPQGASPK